MRGVADHHVVLGARAQRDRAGTGFECVAHQIPQRLGQAIAIAFDIGQAGIVIAHQLDRPCGLGVGQLAHAFEHAVDIGRRERTRWRRVQQLVDQAGQAIDFGRDQADQLAGVVAVHASTQKLCRALEPGERIADLMRQALECSRERGRQGRRRIFTGEFLARMRFQPDLTGLFLGQPQIGEMFAAARECQPGTMHPQGFAADRQSGQERGQAAGFDIELVQSKAQQAPLAHSQPTGEGGIAGGQTSVEPQPGDRSRQQIQLGSDGF